MFSSFMVDSWIAATIVAIVAGAVGFFVVLRRSGFAAHALPQGAFAGAAGASLLGVNILFGLGLFAVIGAVGVGWLSRRGRRDVVVALLLVLLLGVGAFFLSFSSESATQIFALLFGDILSITEMELVAMAIVSAIALLALTALYRPLIYTTTLPEVSESRGVKPHLFETAFLLVVALGTTVTIPVVGTFLMFALMVAPAAAARSFVSRPFRALGVSIALALVIAWESLALSYLTNWPVGFFVGIGGVVIYILSQLCGNQLFHLRKPAIPAS
jgi:zinc/manganese transport system permease protein